jgi:hypothetical protein
MLCDTQCEKEFTFLAGILGVVSNNVCEIVGR